VVEGQAQDRFCHDPAHHAIEVRQHLPSRDSHRFDTRSSEPAVSRGVAGGTVSPLMGFAVDLYRKACIAAEEVEVVRAGRMLASEFQACRSGSKHLPEENFRKAQFSAEAARLSNGSSSAARRDVLEHCGCPSTMLRMVPLPETSSGRILE
jgi:hypothetical protein